MEDTSLAYTLTRDDTTPGKVGWWSLKVARQGGAEEICLFDSKAAGIKVLKALNSGKISEEKARAIGGSASAAKRAKAARAGHDRKVDPESEKGDGRYPVTLALRLGSEEEALLLSARLRRRRRRLKLTRADAGTDIRQCRVENPADLADLLLAMLERAGMNDPALTLDVLEQMQKDRDDDPGDRKARILDLLSAAPDAAPDTAPDIARSLYLGAWEGAVPDGPCPG